MHKNKVTKLWLFISRQRTTEKAGKPIAEATSGTLYEIQPVKEYVADLKTGTTNPHVAV